MKMAAAVCCSLFFEAWWWLGIPPPNAGVVLATPARLHTQDWEREGDGAADGGALVSVLHSWCGRWCRTACRTGCRGVDGRGSRRERAPTRPVWRYWRVRRLWLPPPFTVPTGGFDWWRLF